jgi:hypothetical protein
MINEKDFALIRFHLEMENEIGLHIEMGYLYYQDWLDMFQEFEVVNNEFELSNVTDGNTLSLAIL